MKTHKKAFTIIEVLAVIVISAVLITIVFPRIIASAREARYKACRGQIAIVNEQVELYYVQVGEWPRADLMDMVWDTNRFPDGMPRCPLTGYFYWIYEDTHRVGGHTENNPDSHKELGYTTAGDMTRDSQNFLVGQLARQYDADSNQIQLIRYLDYVYDEAGEHVIAYKSQWYNAYGSLICELHYYNRTWDENGNLASQTVDKIDRRGILQTSTTSYYDEEKNFTSRRVERYRGGSRQNIDRIDIYGSYQYVGGVMRGYAVEYQNSGGASLGSAVVSNIQYDETGKRITNSENTYYTADGTAYFKRRYLDSYDSDLRRVSRTIELYTVRDGQEVYAGKTVTTGLTWDDKGLKAHDMVTRYDKDNNIVKIIDTSNNGYDPEGSRLLDYTAVSKDSENQTTGRRVINSTYDDLGRVTGTTAVFRDADNLVKSVQETYGYTYDESGRPGGFTKAFMDKDRNVAETRAVSDYAYDDSGRRVGHTVTVMNDQGSVVNSYNYDYDGAQGWNFLLACNTYEHKKHTSGGVFIGWIKKENIKLENLSKDGYTTSYTYTIYSDENGTIKETGVYNGTGEEPSI